MSPYSHHPIHFSTPVLHEIRDKGYMPVDMHIHTRHSDAAISIPSLLTRAKHLGTGVAITDHNEIQGVIEACQQSRGVLVIPGIESVHSKGLISSFIFTPLTSWRIILPPISGERSEKASIWHCSYRQKKSSSPRRTITV